MGSVELKDILVTPLKRISTTGGDVLHFLKKTDNGFRGFGEAYFTMIQSGAIKAWKKHTIMHMNLVVPKGHVRFVFHLPNDEDRFRVIDIGENPYARITVPPGIWFGFKGLDASDSLICNFADIVHDIRESERCPVSEIAFEGW